MTVSFTARIMAAHLDAAQFWQQRRDQAASQAGGGNITLARLYRERAERHIAQAQALARAERAAA